MNLRSIAGQVALAASVVCALCAVRVAVARPCAKDGDCPRGFMCLPAGVALADGGFESACASVSCASDSDCGSGTRCEQNLGTRCVIATDGGQSCEPASACVPAWQAPCTSDVECGPGFTCSAAQSEIACGSDQAADVPAYATATTIACADVPKPPFLSLCGGRVDAGSTLPCAPALCDAGSSCLSIQWKMCQAQAPTACSTDGDCPPTWSCACSLRTVRFGLFAADAGESACSNTCVAPNSDLSFGSFANASGAANAGADSGVSTPVALDAGTAVAIHDAGMGRSASSPARLEPRLHRGCSLVGAQASGGCRSWTPFVLAAFALGFRRARNIRVRATNWIRQQRG